MVEVDLENKCEALVVALVVALEPRKCQPIGKTLKPEPSRHKLPKYETVAKRGRNK